MDYIREELERIQKEDRKARLAKLVPSLFVMQSIDRCDAFDLSIQTPKGTQWATDKYPRELLPVIRQYKTALIHALREAEWAISYLTEDGLYPQDKLKIKIQWEKKEE